MAPQSPNLLEAFQNAGPKHPDKGKTVGGPFVPSGGDDGEPKQRAPLSGRFAFLLMAVLVFGAGVLVGRRTATITLAGDGGGEAQEELAGPEEGSILPFEAPATQREPEERPVVRPRFSEVETPTTRAALTPRDKLLSPANRFTAIGITYSTDDDSRQRAQETAGHLVAQGFEAVAVRATGGRFLVLVGAAPDRATIDRLCERLAGAVDARGDYAFDDAYPVNIDDYIDR